MQLTEDLNLYSGSKKLAAQYLAKKLLRGELSLFLGAGASSQLGLPQWWELIRDMGDALSLPEATSISDATPVDELMKLAGKIRRKFSSDADGEYKRLVHHALYKEFKPDESSPTNLLVAIGALLMNSRRGSVSEVLTLNFDNILEWYLDMHGYDSQVIFDVPCLERGSDISIYHPHGYLPYKAVADWSNRIVLDRFSFDQMAGDQLNAWKGITRRMLETKVVLSVGMSFTDPNIRGILADIAPLIQNQMRPAAFWMCLNGSEDKDELIEYNVTPVYFDSYDDYSGFLLNVCQIAAKARSIA